MSHCSRWKQCSSIRLWVVLGWRGANT